MNRDKESYEALVAFATLFISLSAFKSELERFDINFVAFQLNAANFFLWVVIALTICFYLSVVERLASKWLNSPRFWKFIGNTLLGFFGTILAIPLVLFGFWCLAWLVYLGMRNSMFLAQFKIDNWLAVLIISIPSIIVGFRFKSVLNGYFAHRENIKTMNSLLAQQTEAVRHIGKGNYFFSARTSIGAINSAFAYIFRERQISHEVDFLNNIEIAVQQQLITDQQAAIVRESYNGLIKPDTKLFSYPDANGLVGVTASLMKIVDEL